MASNLSSENILRDIHDPDNNSVRTTAEAIILGNVDVDLTLTPDDDAVAIGNRSNTRFVDISVNNELQTKDNEANVTLSSIDVKVATSANQVTGNNSLSSIDNKVSTAANQTTTINRLDTVNTNLSTINTSITTSQPRRLQDGLGNNVTSQTSAGQRALDVGVTVSGAHIDPRSIRPLTASDVVTVQQLVAANLQVTVASSALPSGASTSALQTAGNASLASIDADIDTALSTRASEVTLSSLNSKIPVNLTVKAASTPAVAADPSLVVALSPNSNLVRNIINAGTGVQGALTVGTTAVVVRVGGSNLANRINLTLHNNSLVNMFWGYTSGVTTASGSPIPAGNSASWDVGPNQDIYVITTVAGQNARVTEGA